MTLAKGAGFLVLAAIGGVALAQSPWSPDGKFVMTVDSPASETRELGGVKLLDVTTGRSRKIQARVRPGVAAMDPTGRN
jgi:hypothetical protein